MVEGLTEKVKVVNNYNIDLGRELKR